MKAAILVEQRKPLEIADVELPEELSFGQVLVKISYSGICGSQMNEIDGRCVLIFLANPTCVSDQSVVKLFLRF